MQRWRDLPGWAEAVERARELRPDIPPWAFEKAGEREPPPATYYDQPWWSVHVQLAENAAEAELRRSSPERTVRRATPGSQCPKCRHLREKVNDDAIGWCPKCCRWQYLYQAEFCAFPNAVYRHLACALCHQGAWCRDFKRFGPSANLCAWHAHVHAVGACPRISSGRPLK